MLTEVQIGEIVWIDLVSRLCPLVVGPNGHKRRTLQGEAMSTSTRRRAILALCLITLAAAGTSAQNVRARLQGLVTDTSGTTCITASGEAWQDVNPEVAGLDS